MEKYLIEIYNKEIKSTLNETKYISQFDLTNSIIDSLSVIINSIFK